MEVELVGLDAGTHDWSSLGQHDVFPIILRYLQPAHHLDNGVRVQHYRGLGIAALVCKSWHTSVQAGRKSLFMYVGMGPSGGALRDHLAKFRSVDVVRVASDENVYPLEYPSPAQALRWPMSR
ncbi:hypothetical protein WJX72_007652 [[Myrmecia] bisecta]|uniref:Uncharacterized protein n=1 Tax=[Myrmecia] bisecta TaxID=41462 RepID=A0AAW1QSG7_9CHLO